MVAPIIIFVIVFAVVVIVVVVVVVYVSCILLGASKGAMLYDVKELTKSFQHIRLLQLNDLPPHKRWPLWHQMSVISGCCCFCCCCHSSSCSSCCSQDVEASG